MALSRRTLIQSSVVIGGAAALTDMSLSSAAWAVTGQLTPEHTTLASTLVRGTPGAGGYAPVIVRVRRAAHVAHRPGRHRQPRAYDDPARRCSRFAHMTDVHLVDAQSPMRLEYVDRLEDQYSPGDPIIGLLSSSYRAHEMLTLQVAESMVRAINEVSAAPVSGTPLAFAIQTGDNSDNCQQNEFRWNIDILDGGKQITPDSGNLAQYEGVSDNVSYDRHYWHPDAPPAGQKADIYKSVFGFPQVPGLLAAARKPFTAEGLDMPWYTAFGNHDGLVQGNFPHSLPLEPGVDRTPQGDGGSAGRRHRLTC